MLLAPEETVQPDPASFRLAMTVTHILRFPNGSGYPLCPRCGISLEREFMRYCSCCGQCLGWKSLRHAKVKRWQKPED